MLTTQDIITKLLNNDDQWKKSEILPPGLNKRNSELPPVLHSRDFNLPPGLNKRNSELPPVLHRRDFNLPPVPNKRNLALPPVLHRRVIEFPPVFNKRDLLERSIEDMRPRPGRRSVLNEILEKATRSVPYRGFIRPGRELERSSERDTNSGEANTADMSENKRMWNIFENMNDELLNDLALSEENQ